MLLDPPEWNYDDDGNYVGPEDDDDLGVQERYDALDSESDEDGEEIGSGT